MLKTRAHYESARRDRPGRWSSDDMEAGRRLAKRTVQLRRGGITPDIAWRRRRSVSGQERQEFEDAYQEELDREMSLTEPPLQGFEMCENRKKRVERSVLTRTLIRMEFLLVRRRRVSPHFHRRYAAKI